MRLRLFLAPVLLVGALLGLAACGKEAPKDDSRSATGQVLEGSISDEMLPVDTVRSEPPLEDPEAAEEAAKAGPSAEATDAPAEAEAAVDEAPAPEPAPQAED